MNAQLEEWMSEKVEAEYFASLEPTATHKYPPKTILIDNEPISEECPF